MPFFNLTLLLRGQPTEYFPPILSQFLVQSGVNPKIETRKSGALLVKWKGVPNVGTACFQLGVQGAGGAAHGQWRECNCAASRTADQAQRAVPLALRLPQGGSGGLATGRWPAAGSAESAAADRRT